MIDAATARSLDWPRCTSTVAAANAGSMKVINNIFGSSVGWKFVMAISGGVLFLFVVGHLLGNLQIFLGPEAINRYGHFLQSNLELIWPVRIGLLLMLGLHVWSAIQVSRENKAARPAGYAVHQPVGASYSSRTMLMSGLIILTFIIYHLLHYTVQSQAINFTGQNFHGFVDAKGRHDVFRMMVVGFGNPWVTGFYLLGMALLCLHLGHGVSSMFQSLGLKTKEYGRCLDCGARVVAGLIFLGYSSIPVAVLLGFGKEAIK
jgi:succinate dehydrogenase / fumarate reductase cytochrome b subunit